MSCSCEVEGFGRGFRAASDQASEVIEEYEAKVAWLRAELDQVTHKRRRIPDPDGCYGADDWAHTRCSDKCPPHGLVWPHGDIPHTALKEGGK
jgi:hypothetical protein